LIADAGERKSLRIVMETRARADANAASGLPKSSKDLLLGIAASKKYQEISSSDAISGGIFSGPCRSVIASTHGEIMGQLLGDCITVEATHKIYNGLRVCIPLQFTGDVLHNTEIGDYTGIVFDFAKKSIVPTNYSLYFPAEADSEFGEVPGEVAIALWGLAYHPQWGRAKPGENVYTPLNVNAQKEKLGTVLCAEVFEAGWTYCPIARIDHSFFDRLPRKPGEPEFESPDSTCPAMDSLLEPVQSGQVALGRTGMPYQELDFTLSSRGLMNDEQMYKDFQGLQSDLKGLGCPYGRSLIYQKEGYRCV